ncbi:hypothetical protein OFB47_31435, partial [Escherichia coli]|nr:hypothetical protein [Escherichia coli]
DSVNDSRFRRSEPFQFFSKPDCGYFIGTSCQLRRKTGNLPRKKPDISPGRHRNNTHIAKMLNDLQRGAAD